jgi:hypothetical protein
VRSATIAAVWAQGLVALYLVVAEGSVHSTGVETLFLIRVTSSAMPGRVCLISSTSARMSCSEGWLMTLSTRLAIESKRASISSLGSLTSFAVCHGLHDSRFFPLFICSFVWVHARYRT